MTNKTEPAPQVSVDEFIANISHERRRTEAQTLKAIMERTTGEPAVMWGPTIVGFGTRHYKYASGREGDTFVVGFAPRAAALTVYGVYDAYAEPDPRFDDLGSHTVGKGCLYIKKLEDIDLAVLEQMVRERAAQ